MVVNTGKQDQLDSNGLARLITKHLGDFRREVGGADRSGQIGPDTDAVFATQIVAQIQAYVLATTAITDADEIRRLVKPGSETAFRTNVGLEDIVRMLADSGAIHKGHFELLSGYHSQYFLIFSKLGAIVANRRRLGAEMAARLKARGLRTTCVIAPVTAGALLVQDVANETDSEFAFFEVNSQSRPSGIRLGYSVTDKTVAIVNDMTTTGEGLRAMVEIVRRNGGKVAALCLFATRGDDGLRAVRELQKLNVHVESLVHLDFALTKASNCENCQQSLPIIASKLINR